MESPFESLSPTGQKLFIGLAVVLVITLAGALCAAIFVRG